MVCYATDYINSLYVNALSLLIIYINEAVCGVPLLSDLPCRFHLLTNLLPFLNPEEMSFLQPLTSPCKIAATPVVYPPSWKLGGIPVQC